MTDDELMKLNSDLGDVYNNWVENSGGIGKQLNTQEVCDLMELIMHFSIHIIAELYTSNQKEFGMEPMEFHAWWAIQSQMDMIKHLQPEEPKFDPRLN